MKFLIIGCGSIGQRHISNLLSIGLTNIQVYDSNTHLSKSVKKIFKVSILDSLQFDNTDCTLVCTPPNTHIHYLIKALNNNSHVFIEKPLSNSLNNVLQIQKLTTKKSLQVFVGYNFRFDSGLRKTKKLLEQKIIGKIISFDAYEGWYLPKWRPWQNYRKSYTGSKTLGGGIILDGSHEVNYLQWLGGTISQVFSYNAKIPSLSVETEGIAEALLKFKSGAIGRVHLDFLNPIYNRHCEILGEKGSIVWSFENKTLTINKIKGKKTSQKYGTDNNQMYKDEIKYVIKCINGKPNELLSLDEAIKSLKISLAIKKSGNFGIPIKI